MCVKVPISSASQQLDSLIMKRDDDSAKDTTVTVTAFPITNAIVEDVFQYPVVSKIDDYSIPRFVVEKPSIAPVLPAPVTISAPVEAGDCNIATYKVESDVTLFNCANVEKDVRIELNYDLDKNPNPSDNNDLLELERRLADLAKPNTENATPKEYSL